MGKGPCTYSKYMCGCATAELFSAYDHSELVIGEPKGNKHRTIPLTKEMSELFTRIRNLNIGYDDFVFSSNKKHYTAHDISCACNRRALAAGIEDGSSIHEIRRTVSSQLNTIIPRETAAALLGHLPETNERHYDYDMSSEAQQLEALSKLHTKCTLYDFNTHKEIAEAL